MAWQAEIIGIAETDTIDVIALNSVGESGISRLQSFVCAVPNNPHIVNGSVTQSEYMVSCDEVGNALGYRVYLNDSDLIGEIANNIAPIQIPITGRTAGTTEYMTVRAYGSEGEGKSSNIIDVTLLPANPIIGLYSSQNAVTTSTIQVEWEPVFGATGYSVYLDDTLQSTNALSPYLISGLTSGTRYAIKITANTSRGTSGFSNILTTQTQYLAPTVGVNGITQSGYQLVCGATVPDPIPFGYQSPDGYRACIHNNGTLIVIGESFGGSSVISITKSPEDVGTADIGIQVFAYKGDIGGELSAPKNVFLLPQTPNVSLVSSDPLTPSVGSHNILITWNAAQGAAEYQLTINGVVEDYISSPYNITGLDANTEYDIVVVAINESGTVESNILRQKTAPSVPVDIVISNITATKFDISWASSANAEKYQLYINEQRQTAEYTSTLATDIAFPVPGTRCRVEIVAIGTYGVQTLTSDRSPYRNVCPLVPVVAPTSVGPAIATETTYHLSWSSVEGASHYAIIANGKFNDDYYIASPSPEIQFSTFAEPTTLTVSACIHSGCGVPSAEFVTIIPAPPTTLITIDMADLIQLTMPLTLWWQPRVNAVTYELEISTDEAFNDVVKVVRGITTPSFLVSSGLEEGIQYYWHVRYHNIAGMSDWSAVHSFVLSFAPVQARIPSHNSINVPLKPYLDWNPLSFNNKPGDLAIIRVNAAGAGGVDSFSILALSDIDAKQIIKWTDNGWTTSTGFRGGETVRTIVHNGLSAGQVYEVSGTNFFASGEQIFLFTGDNNANSESQVGFIYGINWGDMNGWDETSVNDYSSALPTDLKESNVSLVGNGAAWYYNGPTTGTKEKILTAINDETNWVVDIGSQKHAWDGAAFVITKPVTTYDWCLTPSLSWPSTPSDDLPIEIVKSATNSSFCFYQFQSEDNALTRLTSYVLGIRRKNDFITGPWGVTRFVSIDVATVPTLIFPTNNSINNPRIVDLMWSQAVGTGQINYTVQLATDADFSTIIFQETLPETTIQVPLVYSTSYYWRVLASDDNGSSDFSPAFYFSVAVHTEAPMLLKPMSGATKQPTSLRFEWDEPVGIPPFTYQIQISENETFLTPLIEATDIATLFFEATDLSYDTNYYWRVRAVGGIWSTYSLFNTKTASPETPILISPNNAAIEESTTMKFIWQSTARAESYRLYLAIANGEGFEDVLNTNIGSASEYTTTLKPFSQYRWQIIAINEGGETSSSPRLFTTGMNVPVLDSAVNDSAAIAGGCINLNWTIQDTTGIVNIKVKRGTVAGIYSDFVVLAPEARTYKWTDLVNGQAYYFAVTAMGNGTETIDSNSKVGIPHDAVMPAPVTGTIVQALDSGGALRLSWNNPSIADFHHVVVVRRTDGNYAVSPVDSMATVIYTGDGNAYIDNGTP